MILIGICGASGSGKTTLARELLIAMKGRAAVLHQDAYYKNNAHLSLEERKELNYDHPDAFDHELLLDDLCRLKGGRSISEKKYDFVNHLRLESGGVIEPENMVVLEGIHAFYDRRVRDMMDFRIYIRADADVCLLRRVKRDIEQRGRTIEDITRQYLTTVKPMFEEYIAGYEKYADVIVGQGGLDQRIVDILAAYGKG